MLDIAAFDAVWRADIDPEQAAEALRIAAGYLRRREPLPDDLADWLADAFESTALKPAKNRAHTLAVELRLKALNRRPKAHWFDVGAFMHRAMTRLDMSQTAAAQAAANKFGIVEATAVAYLKQFTANEQRIAAAKSARKPD